MDPLPPAQRGLIVSNMTAAATPVLLVHGLADNRSVFARLRAVLHRRGYGVVHAVNHSVLTSVHGDIRGAAAELGAHVQRLRDRTGADRVHMVGHSLGGLIARYYVQRLGGHAVVDGLVTVGSPHRGSRAAALLPPTRLVRQLRPGSELISELDAPAAECASRFLAVWSHLDATMVPRASARLDHPDLEVEHFELDHVGHIAMVNNPRVLHHITGWLARQDTTRPTRRTRPEQRAAS
jgi:pimeloyl-ACP methyl ester carboxylesterase